MNIAPPIVDQLIAADAARRHVGARITAAAEAHAGQRDRQRDAIDRLVRDRAAKEGAFEQVIAGFANTPSAYRIAQSFHELVHGAK